MKWNLCNGTSIEDYSVEAHEIEMLLGVTTGFPGVNFQKMAVVLTSPRITVS